MTRRIFMAALFLSLAFTLFPRTGNAQFGLFVSGPRPTPPPTLLTRINISIDAAYRSRENPNYGFTNEARPPDGLLADLRANGFAAADTTDLNQDVSFVYVLSREGKQWTLMVSMVGPYAALFRIVETPTRTKVQAVPKIRTQQFPPEEPQIVDAMSRNQLELIELGILNRRVSLKCQNTHPANVRFYQALFKDSNELPWLTR